MRLFEVFAPPISGFQDVEADNSKPQLNQSRKTKLTLKQIRKLRKMIDVRTYDKKLHRKRVHIQYGPKPESQGPGPI